MYLWCALGLGKRPQNSLPTRPYVGLQLLLPSTYLGRVVSLRHLQTLVSKQHGHALERHPTQQQFDGKRVAKAMSVSTFGASEPEELLQAPLPVTHRTLWFRFPAPKEEQGVIPRGRVERPQHHIRKRAVHRRASLRRVKEKLASDNPVTSQRDGTPDPQAGVTQQED